MTCDATPPATPDAAPTAPEAGCSSHGFGDAPTRDITVGGQTFRVAAGGHDGFWNLAAAGRWEIETFVVLRRLLSPGVRYLDCGAWIGPTVLYAAGLGATVEAYECDPPALDRLAANLALNPDLVPRVSVIPAGLIDRDGPILLHGRLPGDSGSTVFPVVEHGGEETVLARHGAVPALDARRILRDGGWLDDPTALVKIDVEGAEYAILDRLGDAVASAACSFYVSFHPFNLVGDGSRPSRLARTRAAVAWIDQFWDFGWWTGANGTLQPIDKAAFLERELARDQSALYKRATGDGRGLPGILFSRRDDLDDPDPDGFPAGRSPRP